MDDIYSIAIPASQRSESSESSFGDSFESSEHSAPVFVPVGYPTSRNSLPTSQEPHLKDTNLTDSENFEETSLAIKAAISTIFSFDWVTTESDNTQDESTNEPQVNMSNIPQPPPSHKEIDVRTLIPPTIPVPTLWSTCTDVVTFAAYRRDEGKFNQKAAHPLSLKESRGCSFVQRQNIDNVNIHAKYVTKSFASSIPYLFKECYFPGGIFNISKIDDIPGISSSRSGLVLLSVPNLSSKEDTAKWLNGLALGVALKFGIIESESAQPEEHPRRMFYSGNSQIIIPDGIQDCKPDITVISSGTYQSLTNDKSGKMRLRWPLVQALVEITTVATNGKDRVTSTLLSKASNIFASQLQRNYVVGLGLFYHKKDADDNKIINFTIVVIDRAGIICSGAQPITGANFQFFARLIYGMAFGAECILGADPNVTTDHAGCPTAVTIKGQHFTIMQQIFSSPFSFGHGTKTFVVKDIKGHYHVLKDSWVLPSSDLSESQVIQNICNKNAEEFDQSDVRNRFLRDRLVVADNEISNTNDYRYPEPSSSITRIHRRLVTGPIGDPITAYRSRVECLQAFVDALDQLVFMHNKCGLVHGDISIRNLVIVRFLPAILSASDTAAGHASSNGSLYYATTDNSLVPWPTNASPATLDLGSGGKIIDYDSAHKKAQSTSRTSGTVPYMSIEVLEASETGMVHRLDHDIESLLHVLLHIFLFTTPLNVDPQKIKNPNSYVVTKWHWDNPVIVRLHKISDLLRLRAQPNFLLIPYWECISSHIAELIDAIYPLDALNWSGPQNIKTNVAAGFRSALVNAIETCKRFEDGKYPPYASLDNKKRDISSIEVDADGADANASKSKKGRFASGS